MEVLNILAADLLFMNTQLVITCLLIFWCTVFGYYSGCILKQLVDNSYLISPVYIVSIIRLSGHIRDLFIISANHVVHMGA